MEDVSTVLWLKSNILPLLGLWFLYSVHYAFLGSNSSDLECSVNISLWALCFLGRGRREDEGGTLNSRVFFFWHFQASCLKLWCLRVFTLNSVIRSMYGDPLAVAEEYMWPEFGDAEPGPGCRFVLRVRCSRGTRANGLSTEVKDCLDMKAESPPC